MAQPVGTESQSWTIGGLLDWTARHLANKGSEFPRLDTELLLASALGCRRIDLYTRYDEVASEEARRRFRELVKKRIEGCPVAYLVGRKEFFSLELEVTPAVLIPRPESEFVVLECLRLAKELPQPRVLDLGTGSGNIAIAIAVRHKGALITSVDLSEPALEVAARNANKHGVSDRVRLMLGDLFSTIPAGQYFDFIVSNPPYIARDELDLLPIGVRHYEPQLALDGGPGGYMVFDRLIDGAPCFLAPGGHVIVEIGAPQEETARAHLLERGYQVAPTLYDGSRHPRVLRAQR